MSQPRQVATVLFRVLLGGALLVFLAALCSAAPPPADSDTESPRRILQGNVHPLARSEFDAGRADSNLPLERIILHLALRPKAERDLTQLLADQQNPRSPDYHRWLTPDQFGRRFGLSDEDLSRVVAWLQDRGFTVEEVARGRGWINFTGTAGQVERTFRTEMHDYLVAGRLEHANASDPSIPLAIAGLVRGVVSLHSFHSRPMTRTVRPLLLPEFTNGDTSHYLAPADFATIYNVDPLYSAGIDGSGQTIAIVGRTDIKLTDVQHFRTYFGLPPNDPVFVHNGPDPGNLGDDGSQNGLSEENEADLDVEWSGAVARNATIDFVISKSTAASDGVDLSAQYIIDNNVAPIMSESFGDCESDLGSAGNAFESALFAQAAAEGITVFAPSDDSGAAGCDSPTATTGHGLAVSGLCSTPYDICLGGTQFNDVSNPTAYWSSANNPTTKASALSYIPEVAWNESALEAGGSGLFATGGGPSAVYSKPAWQSAPGVPADGARDTPDVSLNAASHDGYMVFQRYTSGSTTFYADSGTSASTPTFAGLLALVLQKTGTRQGAVGSSLYQLATNQYAHGGPAVFHDIVTGNNSVPGVTGYDCGTGYDLATGLGSVDASALVDQWISIPFGGGPCVADATTLCLNGGRFQVRVNWQDFQGNNGSGSVVSGVSSDSSGLFWFFGPSNWELLIKVLDGCPVDGHHWVFGAASTNVQYTITVTDTQTGAIRTYFNPLGTAAAAITDTSAFSTCP